MPTGTVVSRGYLAAAAVRGRVRATFARCAYVAVDGGPLLVLHAAGRDHTPTSLCPAVWPPAGSAVAVGDPVVGRAGHLKIGELVLDARGARVWRPAPARVTGASLVDPGIGVTHRLALRAAAGSTGGLVHELERAVARHDVERVTSCVASLVGRGPGLTPSGDDALVGLLAVTHRLAPAGAPWHHDLLRPAVEAHLHRTGDISAHYLRLAVAGHFGERLIALCDALVAGPRDDVAAAAAAVCATGATSGADALLGVVSGLRLVAAAGAGDRAVAA
ncbi:MAG: hypothetical protein QOJ89_4151 [bacterium]